jgi:PAS domain-containing protein
VPPFFVDSLYLLSHACALVAARRLRGNEPWLSRERSTLAFLAGAALAPALPALLDDEILRVLGITFRSSVPPTVESWLRGVAGILAVVPAVLVFSGQLKAWVGLQPEREWQRPISARNVLELVGEIAVWTATLWITVDFKARHNLNVTYLTFLSPLAFTLLRGLRLATLALAANAVISTTLWNQMHWADPLSAGDLRLLITIYSMTILVLAAVVDERQRGRERMEGLVLDLRESEENFASSFYSAPMFLLITNLEDGRILQVNDAFLEADWLFDF